MNLSESPDYFSGEQFANEVMKALRESEVDLTESQPFQFYLYLNTEEQANACADEINLIGLETKVVSPDDMADDDDFRRRRTSPLNSRTPSRKSLRTRRTRRTKPVGYASPPPRWSPPRRASRKLATR